MLSPPIASARTSQKRFASILAAALCVLSLLVLVELPRSLLVNLGFLDLMKSRLTAHYPIRGPAVYDVAAIGDPRLLDRASTEFDLAMRIYTGEPLALAGLAYVYADADRITEAIPLGLEALEMGYAPVLGNLLLGNLYAASGNSTRIRHWEASAGQDAEIWIRLSTLLFSQRGETNEDGRWEDAIRVLEDGLAKVPLTVPERIRFHMQLSDQYAVVGEPETGLGHAERAAGLDPANREAQGWLAWYLDYYLDEDARALSEARKALALGPDWRAYLVVGDSDLSACLIASAIAAYESGLQTPTPGDWRRVYLLIGLGRARWENHEDLAAIEAWQLAAAWEPNSVAIRQLLDQSQSGSLPRQCEGAPS